MKIDPNAKISPAETSELNRPAPKEDEAMRKVSRQFESLLVNQMVGEMRKTVGNGGLVPQSHAEKVYQGMLDYEYSRTLSDTDQIGLSKLIYDHLLQRYRGG